MTSSANRLRHAPPVGTYSTGARRPYRSTSGCLHQVWLDPPRTHWAQTNSACRAMPPTLNRTSKPLLYCKGPPPGLRLMVRHATPLLRRTPTVTLRAPKEGLLPSLRSIERRDPGRAEAYCKEIHTLEEAGYVLKISPEEVEQSSESLFIPHQWCSTMVRTGSCSTVPSPIGVNH